MFFSNYQKCLGSFDYYYDALSLRTRLTLQPLAWIMRGEIRITFPVS